jgi:hypothetical protein
MNSTRWIEFVPVREGIVRCNLCNREIKSQRMARGAHASSCLRKHGYGPLALALIEKDCAQPDSGF